MSNVTYLPWVNPERQPGGAGDDANVIAGNSVHERPGVGLDVATELHIDDELAWLDTLVIRKLTLSDLSRGEVRRILIDQGLPELDAERWLARYEQFGYVDDERLAQTLVTRWSTSKGKGHGAIAAEMRRRRIDSAVSAAALASCAGDDELLRARELIRGRVARTVVTDRATAQRRLVGFLTRRGFSAGIAWAVTREALDESATRAIDSVEPGIDQRGAEESESPE